MADGATGGSRSFASLPALRAMLEEMRAAPEAIQPSGYCRYLNGLNLSQLEKSVFAQFKRTINGNYFQWLPAGPRDSQFRAVLGWWLSHPMAEPLRAPVVDAEMLDSRIGNALRSPLRRHAYALYVALLWEYTRRHAPRGLLERLEEPELGDPLSVRYRQRLVSQDLGNSVLEYAAITRALHGSPSPGGLVVELGGGYARLAWAFLNARSDLRYFLVDIPPALAIAEEYLRALLPNRFLFRFRRFDRDDQVRAELDEAQIAFLTPNQLDLLDPVRARPFVNGSTLHETRPPQIAHYLSVGRPAQGPLLLYEAVDHVAQPAPWCGHPPQRLSDPVHWCAVFDRRHPIQTTFFEALHDLEAC